MQPQLQVYEGFVVVVSRGCDVIRGVKNTNMRSLILNVIVSVESEGFEWFLVK